MNESEPYKEEKIANARNYWIAVNVSHDRNDMVKFSGIFP